MENQDYAKAVHNAYVQCVEELERNKAQFLNNPGKDFSTVLSSRTTFHFPDENNPLYCFLRNKFLMGIMVITADLDVFFALNAKKK